MKNLFKMVSVLTVALFLTACGGSDTPSEGFSKSGKAGSLNVTYASAKPLVVGDNTITVKVTQGGKALTGATVELKVLMPEMPGMPYMEEVKTLSASGDGYVSNVNFSMGGTWQVKIYIEKDGKKYKYSSSVII